MSWLKDTIQNVQERMHQNVEQRKVELEEERTTEELSYYQRSTEFPSDERIEEVMENYQSSLDTYTLVEILMDNGLTTKEEYHERRNRLEEDLRKEIKKQLMDELQRE